MSKSSSSPKEPIFAEIDSSNQFEFDNPSFPKIPSTFTPVYEVSETGESTTPTTKFLLPQSVELHSSTALPNENLPYFPTLVFTLSKENSLDGSIRSETRSVVQPHVEKQLPKPKILSQTILV
uniref:Uncharacterized protein n=1 Tax=Solanum tuberosum TaxID=4113 RepID=M1DXU6_SOLTU